MMKFFLFFTLLFCGLILFNGAFAQSLTGTTGLYTIPTAELLEDREIAFGVSFFDKKYTGYAHNDYDELAYYTTVGFLPFLEVGLRMTWLIDYPEYNPEKGIDRGQGLGERMPSVRLRLLKEGKTFPAVVVGVHDFISIYGTSDSETNYNALYLVTSKNYTIHHEMIQQIGLHLGYGSDMMDAHYHQFVGLFGGVSINPLDFLRLMVEYDAERFNGGVQFWLLNHLQLTAGLKGFDVFCVGASFRFKL